MLGNVLLVDDHPIFSSGLRTLLERLESTVVLEATTTSEALERAKTTALDVALVDVLIPSAGGPFVVQQLRSSQPTCKIVALSVLDDPLRVVEMLQAGAHGYVLKLQPISELLAALRIIAGGGRYLAPQLPASHIEGLLHKPSHPIQRLTIRERRVFDLLVLGCTSDEIANELAIARSTVETHRRHIMRKLDARSIVQLLHLSTGESRAG